MTRRGDFDLTLYLVAGGAATAGRPLESVIAAGLRGGVTLVQLREKSLDDAALIACARGLKALLAPAGVPLIVNDRVDIALAAGADGVHLGIEDEDPAGARARLGPERILGVSAGTPAEAARVDPAIADYVGVGAVFPTPSKADAGAAIGIAGLVALARGLPLPVVAIGGIDAENAAEVMASGAAQGIAVVSAVCAAADPEAAARALRRAVEAGRARQA